MSTTGLLIIKYLGLSLLCLFNLIVMYYVIIGLLMVMFELLVLYPRNCIIVNNFIQYWVVCVDAIGFVVIINILLIPLVKL